MANLPETPQWEEGIYQIEVSDPVLGGPDGISNRQAKQLASRTSYLKQKVEKGGSDLAAHLAATDPHTQYAMKASPTFTGTPTAPTAANNDNSKKLATTEFVARALAALADSAPETLDTLKELADALGNDPNFATTVLNSLATKLTKDQNGADIPDPDLFVKNLRLGGVAGAPYITSRGRNANGVWTIWSDGAIEVYGTSGVHDAGKATITYPIALPAISRYISIAERLSTDRTVNAVHVSMIIDNEVTASGFTARCQSFDGTQSANSFSWRVMYAPV